MILRCSVRNVSLMMIIAPPARARAANAASMLAGLPQGVGITVTPSVCAAACADRK